MRRIKLILSGAMITAALVINVYAQRLRTAAAD